METHIVSVAWPTNALAVSRADAHSFLTCLRSLALQDLCDPRNTGFVRRSVVVRGEVDLEEEALTGVFLGRADRSQGFLNRSYLQEVALMK